MFKRVLFSIVLIILLCSYQHSFAQFPYNESFKNSNATGIVFGGEPVKAFLTAGKLDPEGNGYLRLTNSDRNQKGFIYSTTPFPATNGLRVEVEYYIYGGAGTGADGITFFLFDAGALSAFQIGGFGGSLGYAQYTKPNPVSPGVSKGYLGVGLDEFGNFSNPTEGRQGGVIGPIGGRSPSSITLRGKGDGASLDSNNYKYLTSVRTDTLGFLLTTGGSRKPNPTESGYRKVFLNLQPARDGKPGYLISVKITTGGAEQKSYDVIKDYYYPEPAPANLAYGIASSTGDEVNIHEIRNITIDVFDKAPDAGNVTDTLCASNNFTTDLNKKMRAFNGAILNKTSLDLNPLIGGRQTTFSTEKGTFSITDAGILTFIPANRLVQGVATASYTITDNVNRTSNIGTISLTLVPLNSAEAGADQNIIINTATGSATLTGNSSPGAQGTWTQISGVAATFADKNAANTTVSNLSPGAYTFQWTLTNGECSESDQIRIVVTNPSIPTALDDEATTTPTEPLTISPIVNDTFIAYPADAASLQIVTNPGNGTVAIVPGTGRVTYTPNSAFSGKDTFTYTVKNTNGTVSNTATITVRVRPVGKTDEAVTPKNTPVTIAVKNNDLSAAGTTVHAGTAPTQGTTVYHADGTITYTPRPDFNGRDTFTYFLKTSEGISSDPIIVEVVINILPVAADDVAPPTSGGPIEIDVTSNDTDSDGNVVKGTVVITEQPKNGTITVDPVTGKVRYVPNPGYFGPDSFSYVIKDDKGGISQPGKVNITVLLPPKIGLAKAAARVEQALNGSYDVDFIFTVRNFGGDPLQNISLQDDLANAFEGSEVKVSEIKVVGSGLVPNTAYNGISNTELLSSTSTLAAGAIELVSLRVNIRLISREGIFNNTAFVKGFSAFFNTEVNDQSTNGLRPDPQAEGDVSYSDPTPLELLAPPLFIPGGFSPNHDGINDLFVIQNKITKKITLEIFNRWGNRIYQSADYQNNWDGKCTEGVFMGDDVPNGTYYYVIVIEGTEKRAGYLTINR